MQYPPHTEMSETARAISLGRCNEFCLCSGHSFKADSEFEELLCCRKGHLSSQEVPMAVQGQGLSRPSPATAAPSKPAPKVKREFFLTVTLIYVSAQPLPRLPLTFVGPLLS